MIEINNLTKRYGLKRAVDNISLSVDKGELVGFLGPNGAGKTTTMNMVTGYIASTQGTITINGHSILDNPIEAKKHLGYLPETPPLYMDMTVLEYLGFVYDLKKVNLNKRAHLSEVCEMAKVTDVHTRLIGNLSKGYRQRVGLAQALIGDPEVLILDEPTVGLDPRQIIEMRNLIKTLGRSKTIILSSHILQEISAVCERIIIINHGKIIASGTPDDMVRSLSNRNQFTVRIIGEKSDILTRLNTLDGIKNVEVLGVYEEGSYDYFVTGETDLRSAMYKVLDSENRIMMLKPNEMTLEEVFIKLIAQEQTIEETQEQVEEIPEAEEEAI